MFSFNFPFSYDPEQDRWSLVQQMHSKRLGVGVSVVNRLLYAIGGFDGNERLASVECYHPENNEWTLLPSMKTGRSGAGVAALNQHIYVVGGFDGSRQLASVERYDTENEVWDTVSPIKIARSALSLTVLDGKLWCMGGFDGHSFLSIVEVYDPNVDKWEEHSSLTSGRSGHASAVIYQPSCASIYMDCVEEPTDHNKKPPNAHDDDESKRGPNTSKPNSSNAGTSSNTLHSFSGDRCNHCDEPNQNQENGHTEQQTKHSRTTQAEDQSKYELEYRKAIGCLLRMDCEEKRLQSEQQRQNNNNNNNIYSPCSIVEPMCEDATMHVPNIEGELNEFDSFDNDNPKKYRRKYSFDEQSEDSYPSENSNSVDSFSSGSVITEHRRHRQCSLSKLKNKFRQNISDFVAWSSSSSSTTQKHPCHSSTSENILQDSINNNNSPSLTNISKLNKVSAATEERKCDLLKRYYKCKLKS